MMDKLFSQMSNCRTVRRAAVARDQLLCGLFRLSIATLFNSNHLLLSSCRMVTGSQFDATWGGFGSAPKFPRPVVRLVKLSLALSLVLCSANERDRFAVFF